MESLDEPERIGSGLGAGCVVALVNEFRFQRTEEALSWRVVPAIALAARRADHAVGRKPPAIGFASIRLATVGRSP